MLCPKGSSQLSGFDITEEDKARTATAWQTQWEEPWQEIQNCRVQAQRRIPVSGKHLAHVVVELPAGRRSLDENGGEGHSHRVLQRAEKTYAHKDITETDENCVAAK